MDKPVVQKRPKVTKQMQVVILSLLHGEHKAFDTKIGRLTLKLVSARAGEGPGASGVKDSVTIEATTNNSCLPKESTTASIHLVLNKCAIQLYDLSAKGQPIYALKLIKIEEEVYTFELSETVVK